MRFIWLAIIVSQAFSGGDVNLFAESPLNLEGEASVELFSDEEYILGPGDVLQILIKDLAFAYTTDVDFSGRIALFTPLYGVETQKYISPGSELKSKAEYMNLVDFKRVYGLTIKNLKDSLPLWYSKHLHVREFEVRILSPRILNVFLTGAIEYNGPVFVRASLRISDVLRDTQNICGFDADINSVIATTHDGETLIVNLENYYKKGDLKDNPVLAKIKSIYVPTIENGIKIMGAVRGYPVKKFKPQALQALAGNYVVTFDANVIMVSCSDSMRVEDALSSAGGLKSYALVNEIYSSSKGKVSLTDYVSVGDVLYVPPFTDKVFVAGEVKSPGFVPYLPGATLDTYISYCGGFSSRAAQRRLYIVRANKKMAVGEAGTIQPGDIVFVPEVKLKWFDDYLRLAEVISSIVITWVTLMSL
ncbi:MAG: SLBB domain-containing protein [Candidatus Hydrothermia bacterium]|nr:SLBB domain-containing protein [Candidatus Hydrothermia bacterium]